MKFAVSTRSTDAENQIFNRDEVKRIFFWVSAEILNKTQEIDPGINRFKGWNFKSFKFWIKTYSFICLLPLFEERWSDWVVNLNNKMT